MQLGLLGSLCSTKRRKMEFKENLESRNGDTVDPNKSEICGISIVVVFHAAAMMQQRQTITGPCWYEKIDLENTKKEKRVKGKENI